MTEEMLSINLFNNTSLDECIAYYIPTENRYDCLHYINDPNGDDSTVHSLIDKVHSMFLGQHYGIHLDGTLDIVNVDEQSDTVDEQSNIVNDQFYDGELTMLKCLFETTNNNRLMELLNQGIVSYRTFFGNIIDDGFSSMEVQFY